MSDYYYQVLHESSEHHYNPHSFITHVENEDWERAAWIFGHYYSHWSVDQPLLEAVNVLHKNRDLSDIAYEAKYYHIPPLLLYSMMRKYRVFSGKIWKILGIFWKMLTLI